jgi:hypothetical protein
MKQKTKAPKPVFKQKKMSKTERMAAIKAEIANSPQPPNRDISMKGGTSI